MGLLTDPGMDRSPLPALLERHHWPLCVCLYICGCLWFLSLAHNALNHGTYFSENALLPGLVQGDFQGDSEALHYLQVSSEGFKGVFRVLDCLRVFSCVSMVFEGLFLSVYSSIFMYEVDDKGVGLS
ncbi:Glycosylphosphatidylinositol anchor attachment 1 protein [Portunus trituberculatus]|uniref:Glycosylphosphatidylinositol anchor attachment 1 protein n=1 Tax=Portunus trituberculatus TaxID=210409 RepID=A0A5B7CZG7_PORTR|nr:Glycosylphosphatidylinositol anchor attachment 1 protein [Portunus trituberculatus]